MTEPVARLSDLRLLRVAHHVEEALESFNEALLERLPEGPVREAAAEIRSEGEAHQALDATMQDFHSSLKDAVEEMSPGDVLQAMIDAERFAHDFYLSMQDQVADAKTFGIVRGLMTEEDSHTDAVRRARDALGDL